LARQYGASLAEDQTEAVTKIRGAELMLNRAVGCENSPLGCNILSRGAMGVRQFDSDFCPEISKTDFPNPRDAVIRFMNVEWCARNREVCGRFAFLGPFSGAFSSFSDSPQTIRSATLVGGRVRRCVKHRTKA
jgi:hypothetical protein